MHQAQWSPERPLPPAVSLASQSHHEKPPEVTCTSRGNPGFPASTRESPRETFFNTSRGQIPLPWLGSNDALPLAIRMETRLPCRPTRGSLTSPSYLERTRTRGPPLENNPEPPPSSRLEGLRRCRGWRRFTGSRRECGDVPLPGGVLAEKERRLDELDAFDLDFAAQQRREVEIEANRLRAQEIALGKTRVFLHPHAVQA